MSKTIVINLYGGSGVGKSTVAALLFAQMKMFRMNVELVREYVKLWAWSGKQIRPADQIYLLGKQSAYESVLYDKVDFIVTDSPVLLAGAYAEWHSGDEGRYVSDAALAYCKTSTRAHKVTYLNYFLGRDNQFDSRGRYETEEEARHFDEFLMSYLAEKMGPYVVVRGSEQEKVNTILHDVNAKIKETQGSKT